MNSHTKYRLLLIGMVVAASSWPIRAQDEGIAPEAVRAVTRPDGLTYVYHTKSLPLGYGFRLLRDGMPLHAYPIYSTQDGETLRAGLKEDFQRLAAPIGEETPTGLLLRLQSDRLLGNLATFMYPEAARALGRLFIDSTATFGSTVVYRFEFVDANGNSIGQSLEGISRIQPFQAKRPTDLRAENRGTAVRLHWRYPQPSPDDQGEDAVITFHGYRQSEDRPQRIDTYAVLRNALVDSFSLDFEATGVGAVERYLVVAVDVTGREGPRSDVLTYTVRDDVPPQIVSTVKADVTGKNSVHVRWVESPSTDVVGYRVYRTDRGDDQAVYTKLTSDTLVTGRLRFLDETADGTGGQGYFYSVTAVDGAGNESALSNAAMALVYDDEPPPAVEGFSAEYLLDQDAVALSWSTENEPGDFQTYLVFRRNLNELAAKADVRLNENDVVSGSFVDRGPDGLGFREGELYRWSIFSADSTRNFGDTTSVDFRVPNLRPPSVPSDLAARVVDGKLIQLTWTGSSELDLEQYRIYRSSELETDSLVGETIVARPGFADEEVTPPIAFTYRVTAVDTSGNESKPSEPAIVTMRDRDPPRSVRNVRAYREADGTVMVTWEPVVAHDLAGYRVYRSASRTGRYVAAADAPSDVTNWHDETAPSSAWYRVRSVDSSGNESMPGEPARIHPASARPATVQ